MSKMISKQMLEIALFVPTLSLYYLMLEKFVCANLTEGSSMEPTIGDSTSVLVDKFFFKFSGKIDHYCTVSERVVFTFF